MIRRVGLILPILLCLSSCATNPAERVVRVDYLSVDVLRDRDEGGVVRNDQCTLTDPGQLEALCGFFPEMNSEAESTIRGGWYPLIIVRFHTSDGSVTYVGSDYRLYRMGKGERGDFVVKGDFIDFVESLPMHPPPAPPRIPGT